MSDLMWRVLGYARDGKSLWSNCHGQSQHGGRSRVVYALYKRGLIDHDHKITRQGIASLEMHLDKTKRPTV